MHSAQIPRSHKLHDWHVDILSTWVEGPGQLNKALIRCFGDISRFPADKSSGGWCANFETNSKNKMYLVMWERETSPFIVSVILQRWNTEKKCISNVKEKKRWRTACMDHTMRSADKHLCSLSGGKSPSVPWIACDRCYRGPILLYIFCWMFTVEPVSGGDAKSEQTKER